MATASFWARTIDARRSTLNHGKQNEPRGDGRVSVDRVRFICRFVSESIDKILLAVQCLSWSCFNVFISLHVSENNNNNRKMSLNVLRDRIRSFAWERNEELVASHVHRFRLMFLVRAFNVAFLFSFALFPYLIAPTRRFNVGSNCDVLVCFVFFVWLFSSSSLEGEMIEGPIGVHRLEWCIANFVRVSVCQCVCVAKRQSIDSCLNCSGAILHRPARTRVQIWTIRARCCVDIKVAFSLHADGWQSEMLLFYLFVFYF